MAKSKYLFTEEQIQDIKDMYRNENIKQDNIAEKYNVTRSVIAKYLKDIIRLYEDEEWIKQKYCIERLTKRKIAELAHCNEDTIMQYMKKYGIITDPNIGRYRKYTYDNEYFKSVNTQNKAYWLGFIVADGGIRNISVKYNKDKKFGSEKRLVILLARKDKSHLEKFRIAIKTNAKIVDGETFLKITGKTYPNSGLKIYSVKIVNDLINLGVIPNKSTKEVMPLVDKSLYKHVIRGVFDGDGCFSYWYSKGDSAWVCSWGIVGGLSLLETIQDYIFEQLNITTTITTEGSIYKIVTSGINAENIMNWMYINAETYLDRKFDKYSEWNLVKMLNDF